MLKAEKLEIENLVKHVAFKVVLREEVPENANILPGSFVLDFKM